MQLHCTKYLYMDTFISYPIPQPIRVPYNSPLLQLPTSMPTFSHHLFQAPFQFGTIFPRLLTFRSHVACVLTLHFLFVYYLIAHTLYVTRVHALISQLCSYYARATSRSGRGGHGRPTFGPIFFFSTSWQLISFCVFFYKLFCWVKK